MISESLNTISLIHTKIILKHTHFSCRIIFLEVSIIFFNYDAVCKISYSFKLLHFFFYLKSAFWFLLDKYSKVFSFKVNIGIFKWYQLHSSAF